MISLNKTIPSSIDTITYRFWCPGCGMENQIEISRGTDNYFLKNIECPRCQIPGSACFNEHSKKIEIEWNTVEAEPIK